MRGADREAVFLVVQDVPAVRSRDAQRYAEACRDIPQLMALGVGLGFAVEVEGVPERELTDDVVG